MSKNFRQIIEYITSPDYEYPLPSHYVELLHNESLKVEYAQKNDVLISNEMPSNSIYLLLDGCCCTEKYSPSGKLLKSIAVGPVQIYGLFEAVHPTLSYHTATIRCISFCAYIRISKDRYVNELLSDPLLGWINIQYLSSFINVVLTENDKLLLNNTHDQLLLHLYNQSAGSAFPIIIREKKEELAQILNISLRTLYRHLDTLYKEEILSSDKGKIVITQEQYNKIEDIISKIF